MKTSTSKSGSRPRVLNPRAALILAVVLGVTVVGVRKVHDRQMSRTVQFLRDTAFKSLASEDYRNAQLQLSQYLSLKSNDPEARERLSWVLSEHIKTPQSFEQAIRLNEDLLRTDLTNYELRLRHTRLLIKQNRMADAKAHLDLLQSAMPDEAEVWYLSAVVAGAGRYPAGAMKCLKRSLRCAKKIPETYALLAKLADESTPPELQPEALMQQMIAQCPNEKAYQIRADYRIEKQLWFDAISDLWKSLEETPDDMILNAKLVRCLQALESNNESDAAQDRAIAQAIQRGCDHFRERIAESGQIPALRLYLAALQWKNKDRDDAINGLEQAIQVMPRSFSLHETLIEYLVAENQHQKARRLLESIPAGGLAREVYHYSHGRILMAEKHWKQAADSLEQALAFGRKDSALFGRAQMSYAICRSQTGESRVALEAFRSVVSTRPDSTAARLGIAAAWVQSGQLDLAIAEYRQLKNITGVTASLADLMIQRNLQQPESLRNWDEIDELTREVNPQIADPIQRALLRADRLFATGQIVTALHTLEHATAMYPDRKEIVSAQRRLNGEFSVGINERLAQLAAEEPSNAEVQAALIRQKLNSEGPDAAIALLETTARPKNSAAESQETTLLLAIRISNLIVSLERKGGDSEVTRMFEQAAIRYAEQLVLLSPKHEANLVKTLMHVGRTSDAMKAVTVLPVKDRPEMRAACLLEVVRPESTRETTLPTITNAMYALVGQYPNNMELRVRYAELMIYARQYSYAEQTLATLSPETVNVPQVLSLRAWLRSAEEKNIPEAIELINQALRSAPQSSAFREIKARILLTQNQADEAMRMLEAIPEQELSLSGQVYLLASLLKLERDAEAHTIFEQIHPLHDADSLYPADEDLLKAISKQILTPSTAQR
jgi:tetratricopeptide (TPR) repeat protein